jgi:hypothetical protein
VGLDTNTITVITNAAASDKDVSATFVGGIDNDTFTVQTGATFTGDVTIDATGDLQATGGADTLVLNAAASDLDVDSLTMSGIEAITVDDAGGTVTVQAADITGETFELSGTLANDVLTVQGAATAETIDLSNVTIGATAGDFNVLGSAGADTITASAGVDVFTYTADTQLGDTINDFAQTGADKLYLDVGGDANATATTLFDTVGTLLGDYLALSATPGAISITDLARFGTAFKNATALTDLVVEANAAATATVALTTGALLTGVTGISAAAIAAAINGAVVTNAGGTASEAFSALDNASGVVFGLTTGGILFVANITAGTAKTTSVSASEVGDILTLAVFDGVNMPAVADIVFV